MRARWRSIASAPAWAREHMVFLTLGTGLGAGIIAAGSLYLGANGDAGEIGHVRLSPTGPVGYHKAGSIEGWSSGGGIAQLAVRMLAQAEKRGRSERVARADGEGWVDGAGCGHRGAGGGCGGA